MRSVTEITGLVESVMAAAGADPKNLDLRDAALGAAIDVLRGRPVQEPVLLNVVTGVRTDPMTGELIFDQHAIELPPGTRVLEPISQ